MTAISWKNPVNGDWNVAADWSTNTVPGLGDAVTISGVGAYIVRISSADLAHDLTFNASQAALLENAGSLTMAGVLTVDSGLVSLNEANTIGGVALAGGVLAVGNGGALGVGGVTLLAGELLGTASETLANGLSISATSTIAAAHGTTLTETGFTNISANSTLNFGALGQDGVVVWNPAGFAISTPITFNVAAGTLKAGSDFLADTISNGAKPTTVAAGATLDLGGFGLSLSNLLGAGALIDSGAAATLTLAGANFSGVISGPLALVSNGAVALSGANTYTGATTIDSGDKVQLGVGGATGSIGSGAIIDNGTLLIERNNAVTLTNAISGPGNLEQFGTGVTTINAANTYSGGTAISAGTLAIGNGGALGPGTIAISGGELLGAATETLANGLSFSGISTIAAAHGTTLNENASSMNIAGNSTLNFGAAGQDGTILWHLPTGTTFGSPLPSINVQAGTLKGADSSFGFFLDDEAITVAAGATIDLAGNSTEFINLAGAGAVIDSGAPATLSLGAANFSGSISGALSLVFNGATALSGVENYTGGATLGTSGTVANTGVYDIVGNTNISGNPVSSFINNGLFEKTGGGGVSDVTSNFINGGTLNVLSGSIEFSGGFTNTGVIHGRVTQSGGVTTVSALVPSDFNEDGMSDILWQNANGQAAIWEINGTSQIPGGNSPIEPNPGPSWKVIGTGDFNGDGHADVLWQNANGQAAAVEMNGNTVIGGGAVSANPGPSWTVIGTGDFNGDGLSDILWQNANGQAAAVEMNGNTVIGGGAVSPNPGPAWKAIGTGDFNGDGFSDILFQNTNTGQVSIWEMNGNSLIGGGRVSPNPGLAWKAIGTGDFNGDGFSDILFQNTNTGQATIWEMNGNTLIGGGPAGPDPGPTWHAIGTGDFNGDGFSDILWQNDSGQASIWEMNGTTQIPDGESSGGPQSRAELASGRLSKDP